MNPATRPAALAAAGALLLLSASGTHPATIRVPADQPTIAAALGAATAGDEVVVDCGSYTESRLLVPSGVTVRSATARPDCVELRDGAHENRFRVWDVTDVLIRGFTLRVFDASAISVAGASGVRIELCDFEENRNRRGRSNINIQDSEVTVGDCRFSPPGGISFLDSHLIRASGSVTIERCEFDYVAATTGYANAIVAFSGSGPHALRDSRFTNAYGTCVTVAGGDVLVEDTTFRRGSADFLSAPTLGTVAIGSLTFRGCVAESTGQFTPYGYPESRGCFETGPGASLTLDQCTFVDPIGRSPFISAEGPVRVESCIITNPQFPSVFHCAGGPLEILCTDVYAASTPLFTGSCPPDTAGLFHADPRFCDPEAGDYRLDGASRCLPAHSPCGELVGALGAGCGTVAVQERSWGKIKNLYR